MQTRVLLKHSCASKTICRLVRQAGAQSQGFQNLQSDQIWWPYLEKLLNSGPERLEPVHKSIQGLQPGPSSVYYLMHGWCDSSQVPWHMVLVTDPKSYGAVAKFSRVWSCFYFLYLEP